MSGNFRKGFSIPETTLINLINDEPSLPVPLPSSGPSQFQTYTNYKFELEDSIENLLSAINVLEVKHDKWLEIIELVPEDKKKGRRRSLGLITQV